MSRPVRARHGPVAASIRRSRRPPLRRKLGRWKHCTIAPGCALENRLQQGQARRQGDPYPSGIQAGGAARGCKLRAWPLAPCITRFQSTMGPMLRSRLSSRKLRGSSRRQRSTYWLTTPKISLLTRLAAALMEITALRAQPRGFAFERFQPMDDRFSADAATVNRDHGDLHRTARGAECSASHSNPSRGVSSPPEAAC